MPFWLLRLFWFARGRRYVTLHIEGLPGSLEGVLAGTTRGHYILLAPKLLEGEQQTRKLDGHVEVPRARVLFVQVTKAES